MELKPCPFCGGAGTIRYRKPTDDFIPECANEDCIASYMLGNMFPTMQDAADAWNRRKADDTHGLWEV